MATRLLELACYDPSCRPPSAGGTGGSLKRGALPDVAVKDVRFAYRPRHPDGHADPGEIVWARVPFQDDPSQSKIRPVLVVGRTESGTLVGLQLTSKSHHKDSIPMEWSAHERRSYIRTDRFIQIDASNYQREGAYVKKPTYQDVIDTVTRAHGVTAVEFHITEVASFACQSAACAPPPVGTGGSIGKGKGGFKGPSVGGDTRFDRVAPKPAFLTFRHEGMDEVGAGDEGLPWKDRAASFLSDWYTATGLPGGHGVIVDVDVKSDTHALVHGTVVNEYGRQVGYFDRIVDIDTNNQRIVVSHEEFKLDEAVQGLGIGEAINAHTTAAYEKYGVDRITLMAGYSVGGYAWATAGFRWDVPPADVSKRAAMVSSHIGIYGKRAYDNPDMTPEQRHVVKQELDTLIEAARAGADVQPAHLAAVGRDFTYQRKMVGDDREFTSWPGKDMMLGSTWNGVYYLGESRKAVTAAVEEFYSPTQPRDKEGQWVAYRSSLTSLSQDTLDRAIKQGEAGIFGEGETGTTPWPRLPRRKGERPYDQALVDEALRKPPVLEKVDPRILFATQPGLVRSHLRYYLGDEYKRTGKPSADQQAPANAFPMIYVNKRGEHIILTGHHRAAAALVKGGELDAIVVRER